MSEITKGSVWFTPDKPIDGDVWFIADTHFNHRNIIKYCDRPWNSGVNGEPTPEDVEAMNEAMIKNWNEYVGKDDVVWHLGDFCLGRDQENEIPRIVERLNGKINLVLGNHDNHPIQFYYDAGFNRVYDRDVLLNDFIILSHAPKEFVKAPFFNVYGHVHDCSTYKTYSDDSCCVCVERHNYRPVCWEEIRQTYASIRSCYEEEINNRKD